MSDNPFRDHVQQIADGEVSDPRLSADEARAILAFVDERLAQKAEPDPPVEDHP